MNGIMGSPNIKEMAAKMPVMIQGTPKATMD